MIMTGTVRWKALPRFTCFGIGLLAATLTNVSADSTKVVVVPLLDDQPEKHYAIVDANNKIVSGAFGGREHRPLIMSSQGYVSELNPTNGKLDLAISVLCTGPNCTGLAYMDFLHTLDQTSNGGISVDQTDTVIGAVYKVSDTNTLGTPIEYWYVPKTPTFVDNLPVQSIRAYDWDTNNVVCDAITATVTKAAETFPNDPSITGFENTPFAAPLRYDYR
jgi:hypothetical protein